MSVAQWIYLFSQATAEQFAITSPGRSPTRSMVVHTVELAINVASHDCTSSENSANIHPNLKMDKKILGIPLLTT